MSEDSVSTGSRSLFTSLVLPHVRYSPCQLYQYSRGVVVNVYTVSYNEPVGVWWGTGECTV